MGVRFECPRGHKLHVKAHLAGQRGICPECGVRFIVPSFSGGRVAEAPAEATSAQGGSKSSIDAPNAADLLEAQLAQQAAQRRVAPEALPAAEASGAVAWYVRPPSGGQFGPATTEGFHAWIAEGRVPDDALVWRTGWSEWKPGSDLRSLTPGATPPPGTSELPAPKSPAVARASDSNHKFGELITGELGDSAVLARPVDAVRAARRRRQQFNQQMTILLGAVAIVLLVVLMAVLSR